jgi:hypothetical protein
LVASVIVLLSNPDDVHGDMVTEALLRKGVEVYRLHTEDFPRELKLTLTPSGGHAKAPDSYLPLSTVRSVWFRRPRRPSFGSEDPGPLAHQQCVSALRALYLTLRDRFWVNPPWLQMNVAEDKLLQLRVAQRCGFKVPATLITNDAEHAMAFFREREGTVIYKPYELPGNVFGSAFIYTSEVSEHHFEDPARFRSAPVFLQEAIPKKTELRITIIGRRIFASEILSGEFPESRVDWRRGIFRGLPERAASLPENIQAACLRLMDELGLVFGAIDMILRPNGEYVFLEINPGGQWIWVELKTGLPLLDAFCEMLIQGRVDYELGGARPVVTAREFSKEPPKPE